MNKSCSVIQVDKTTGENRVRSAFFLRNVPKN